MHVPYAQKAHIRRLELELRQTVPFAPLGLIGRSPGLHIIADSARGAHTKPLRQRLRAWLALPARTPPV